MDFTAVVINDYSVGIKAVFNEFRNISDESIEAFKARYSELPKEILEINAGCAFRDKKFSEIKAIIDRKNSHSKSGIEASNDE
ncbi:hypothetical protein [Snodgrassella alvi]|uniref:hypothetical protein n=1 Tax=Snodgrassella alvi TaxID=1196083 RepID=UPI000C1EE373|nr:hypothetical protein [Snodgrassella alvi]PIT21442.1 hypothetical protein BGI34_01155 [Snodgrassella alvi]